VAGALFIRLFQIAPLFSYKDRPAIALRQFQRERFKLPGCAAARAKRQ